MTNAAVPVLELCGLRKRFGATTALSDGNLRVHPGSLHALLGENGAGKSTMIGIVAGAVSADAGQLILDGEVRTIRDPRSALYAGIGVVYQELSVFPDLTVAENIALTDVRTRVRGAFRWRSAATIATAALGRLGAAAAAIHPDARLADLRVDQRQLVEIARVLERGARVVLLDEPTSSLSRSEVVVLFELIRSLARDGVAFIFVSHRLAEVRELCDTVTVLRNGRTIVDGHRLADVSDEELVSAMAGSELESVMRAERGADAASGRGRVVLSVRDRRYPDAPALEAREREIVGLAGLAGSGRSTIMKHVFGLTRRPDLEVELFGAAAHVRTPAAAVGLGIAYVSEDRRQSGIFPSLPLGETMMMPVRVGRRQRLIGREISAVRELIRSLRMVAREDQPPETLSGGNQQKAVVGRWLQLQPRLFLLDEPTRGVDVRSKAELHTLMRSFAAQGAAVVVISSELQELTALCHRIAVIADGRVVGSLEGDDISEDAILAMIARGLSIEQERTFA
jgi:ABC-type sugar transport system ATPase subunit